MASLVSWLTYGRFWFPVTHISHFGTHFNITYDQNAWASGSLSISFNNSSFANSKRVYPSGFAISCTIRPIFLKLLLCHLAWRVFKFWDKSLVRFVTPWLLWYIEDMFGVTKGPPSWYWKVIGTMERNKWWVRFKYMDHWWEIFKNQPISFDWGP